MSLSLSFSLNLWSTHSLSFIFIFLAAAAQSILLKIQCSLENYLLRRKRDWGNSAFGWAAKKSHLSTSHSNKLDNNLLKLYSRKGSALFYRQLFVFPSSSSLSSCLLSEVLSLFLSVSSIVIMLLILYVSFISLCIEFTLFTQRKRWLGWVRARKTRFQFISKSKTRINPKKYWET